MKLQIKSLERKNTTRESMSPIEVLELSRQRRILKLQRVEDASLKPKYNYLNREIKHKTKECNDNLCENCVEKY